MQRAKKKRPLHGNRRLVRLSIEALIASKPFRQGVAEYQSGKWSEIRGNWRHANAQELYERGRLVAALMGRQPITVSVYLAASERGAIPPSVIATPNPAA